MSFDDATNIGTVGITDYAQKSLGDVVFIELPEAGAQVKKGGEYLLKPPRKSSSTGNTDIEPCPPHHIDSSLRMVQTTLEPLNL